MEFPRRTAKPLKRMLSERITHARKNLRRNVPYDYSMKFKIEIEAHKEKIKKEYIIAASDAEEFSRELVRIEREWVIETGILNFTTLRLR